MAVEEFDTQFSYMIPTEDFTVLQMSNEIIENMHMGMSPGTYEGYDLVINCEPRVHPRLWTFMHTKNPNLTFVHFPMEDEDDFELVKETIVSLAMMALHYSLHDKKVLIHCSAGLNRSGVITAVALWLAGVQDPISLIREKRDKWALCNQSFEKWFNDNFSEIKETP